MRTNYNIIIEKVLRLITNINFKEINTLKEKEDKKKLLKYINQEYMQLSEYKHLISNIKFTKSDILDIIYQIISLIKNNEHDNVKKTFNYTKKIIKDASKNGFTWPNSNKCFYKIEEELKV